MFQEKVEASLRTERSDAMFGAPGLTTRNNKAIRNKKIQISIRYCNLGVSDVSRGAYLFLPAHTLLRPGSSGSAEVCGPQAGHRPAGGAAEPTQRGERCAQPGRRGGAAPLGFKERRAWGGH